MSGWTEEERAKFRAEIAPRVAEVVDHAPPLTPEQVDRLRVLIGAELAGRARARADQRKKSA